MRPKQDLRETYGDLREIWAKKLRTLQGVPKKTLVSVQMLLEALKSELQMKVG